ncbi:predicted protein [Histoplasma mississippiense (nom. inval.)]|uniref:predicted protein n=1 Tax=Ajellomyces capsulatus (strain NAm1 / WU24) TaxID=2059318 RepID=UPI000157C946|nr:predicted protein [Histoplasma mississippiense (nom. inval.)]EDN09661.1 predicted protein [Histoplasma mississippiense (nom. inval.)]
MFVHTHIAKYKSLSTELHTTTNTRTFIKSISASSCLSIMESLDSALPEVRQDIEQNIADLDDLYSALLQTRWDIEQNISNLKEPFQRLINAETIGDIRKYLLDLSPAFCELHLLFDRLGGFTSCALGMDVEKRELDEFRCHIAELWGDYGHALQMDDPKSSRQHPPRALLGGNATGAWAQSEFPGGKMRPSSIFRSDTLFFASGELLRMDIRSLLNPVDEGERTRIAAFASTKLRNRPQPPLITQSQVNFPHRANITELPIRLKQPIAGHLNTKDIAHLARTCKSFLSIELCLYETVNLDASKKAYFHVLKLSAMINKDSTLAGHIKTLEIGDLRRKDTRQVDELDELVKAAGWETSPSADESVARLLSQLSSLKSFCLNRLHGEVHLTTFNFATLPTLTRLKVPAESLVSRPSPLIHHLPPTLECLYVKEANDEVNEDTLPQLLIDYITAASARLKLVSIQSYAKYWKDRAASLNNACKNCGVKLGLQYRTGMREVWNSGYIAVLKTHGRKGPANKSHDRIDQVTTMAESIQQRSSVDSRENISSSSTDSTRPTSPVPATRIWELAAHGSVCCEESAAGEAVHIVLSRNALNLQPSRSVPDWTQSIYTVLAESRSIMPFQQMYKPLSQEEMGYIRKRLEEYTDEVRRHIHKLNWFDCAVILADARTLFSYIALLEPMIKTQQTEPRSKKRSMHPTGTAGQENCGKRRRRH